VSLLAACAPRHPPVAPALPQRAVVAYSVGGAPIEVFTCGQGHGGLLVVGGTHGDERGSALLVRQLALRLTCPASGTPVTIVPWLNPDGLWSASRANARGVDLNRNLPTRSWTPHASHGHAPLSEPETRALYELLRRARPAFTLSVHEGSEALVDYDGPAYEASARVAACAGLPVERIGAHPGSLGSLVGVDWGLPLVTLELPRWTSRLESDELWALYGQCLRYAVEVVPAIAAREAELAASPAGAPPPASAPTQAAR